jgi:hypothetical protein
MFLALDESKEYSKKVFGALVLPKEKLSELEKEWVELRLKHKLFAEIKWERIDQYYRRYFDFLDLFFKYKSAAFHSICFREQDKSYNSAYLLIRSISWKIENEGINKALFILFDESGSIGEKETKKIKEIAETDSRFKLKIEFCNQGTSHILGALQIADIITGATATRINNITVGKEKNSIIKYLESKNNGFQLGWPGGVKLTGLYEYKISHFNPISGYSKKENAI